MTFTMRAWTARQFVLVALLLVVMTLAVALGFLDWRMEQVVGAVERAAMTDELDALTVIAREDGPGALRDALDVTSRVRGDRTLHQLVDRHGAPLAGDLGGWPRPVSRDGVWARFSMIEDDGQETDAIGVARTLPDGSRLLIGRSLADHRAIHGAALAAFAASLLFAVGVTVAIGFWVERRLVARVGDFADTAEAVMAGRLDARVPAPDSRDEFSHLARTLNAMLDRIETLMTGMRAVTDSLAHDLRTPLTRLAARLESASNPDSPDRAEALAAAQTEAERLRSTFETLIDIARAESGVSRDAMAETDVGALVEDVCELFSPTAEDKHLSLHVEAPRLHLSIQGQLVAQAIGNLLDNAIKFTPADGAIWVSVRRVQDGADIEVRDTGPGIPAEARTAAVARFQRLARDANAPGAGLGLSIAAAAAHLHGGRLRLEDAGPGLRAVLELRAG